MAKKLMNFYLAQETIERLKALSEKMHVSQATIVQLALNDYLNRHQPDRTTDDRARYGEE